MHKISDIISFISKSILKKIVELRNKDKNKIVGKELLGEVSVSIKTLYTEYNFSIPIDIKNLFGKKYRMCMGKK